MSKTDAKDTTKAPNKAAPQTDATAADSGATALVSAAQAQPATPTAPDEHHGRGGLFIRQSDGTRLKAQPAPAETPDQPEKDTP